MEAGRAKLAFVSTMISSLQGPVVAVEEQLGKEEKYFKKNTDCTCLSQGDRELSRRLAGWLILREQRILIVSAGSCFDAGTV